MLRVLAERMAESSCLVTFNGKSFDWPLLRTRFVLNRVPVPRQLPHLDLLHCVAARVQAPRLAGRGWSSSRSTCSGTTGSATWTGR